MPLCVISFLSKPFSPLALSLLHKLFCNCDTVGYLNFGRIEKRIRFFVTSACSRRTGAASQSFERMHKLLSHRHNTLVFGGMVLYCAGAEGRSACQKDSQGILAVHHEFIHARVPWALARGLFELQSQFVLGCRLPNGCTQLANARRAHTTESGLCHLCLQPWL